jgi:hypothetical protein
LFPGRIRIRFKSVRFDGYITEQEQYDNKGTDNFKWAFPETHEAITFEE